MTPNRSAGRIEDELWEAFVARAKSEGLSNTDALRRLMRWWLGMPEPVPLADTGSGSEALRSS